MRAADRTQRIGKGKAICLDYQQAALQEYFGNVPAVLGLDSKKTGELIGQRDE